jgi:protein-tyrosine phosphatase
MGTQTLPDPEETMSAPKKTRNAKPKRSPPGISEIAPGVFVGGWKDAVQFEGARFCVLDEAPEDMPPATHIAIYDGKSDKVNLKSLDRLATAMRTARGRGEAVLVFCGHGIRRSPLGGAWYLHRSEGVPLDAAYERIQAVRPIVEHARDWVPNAEELERS